MGESSLFPFPSYDLSQSYRFDDDMARLLTDLQYNKDDITLTSDETRDLNPRRYRASTPGLDAVFNPEASLVYITYDDRSSRMANPVEADIIAALASATHRFTPWSPDVSGGSGLAEALGEPHLTQHDTDKTGDRYSFGVVTPHNAQRGTLTAQLPPAVTTNTVELYQGDDRDVIAVSATVSNPEFARSEDEFILDARRLLVAISRSKYLTVVVSSTSLFEVAPRNAADLDNGPIWGRLFTLVTDGGNTTPTWKGSLDEFTPHAPTMPDANLRVHEY